MTDSSNLQKALAVLEIGGVVAFPTETVYGLGARIDRPEALKKIFSVKQRPFFDPLIVHVNSIAMAQDLSLGWTPICQRLAEVFWPGPLTLVTEKSARVDELISSGLSTVGLRWPRSKMAEALITGSGVGIAAPSANRFGRTSPTTAAHVRAEFGDSVLILDGDESEVGIESTVLAVHGSELSLLRPGYITRAHIEQALQDFAGSYSWRNADQLSGAQAAPGRMKHHYMPAVPLVWASGASANLDLAEIAKILESRADELPREVEGVALPVRNQFASGQELKLSLDPALAARQLYADLRATSASGADFLVFRLRPEMSGELWQAVLERLTKAASLKLA